MRIFLATFLLLFIFAFNSQNIVLAQDATEVSCFDYYRFGSVKVNVSPENNLLPPGSVVALTGTIRNENAYPIVSGSVYLRIFRVDEEDNVLDTADFYLAKDNISIDASSTIPVTLNWNVPNYLRDGKYRVISYFASNKKFNLQGLTFTEDISGGETYFIIKGTNKTGIYFDRASLKINNNKYTYSSFSPVVPDDGKPVVISGKIINDTDTERAVKVFHDVYKWDSQNVGNFVETVDENIFVPANSSANFSVSLPHHEFPVYYVVSRLEYKGVKSLLPVRYIIDGKQHYRLNFPTILEFPLEKNKEIPFVTCFHGMGMGGGVAGHVYEPALGEQAEEMSVHANFKVTAFDKNQRSLGEKNFTATVTDDMSGALTNFTFVDNLDSVRFKVDMTVNDKLYDTVEVEYDCKNINENSCVDKGDESQIFQYVHAVSDFTLSVKTILKIILTLSLLLIGFLIFWTIKRRRDAGLLVLVFFASFILGERVQAGTMLWTGTTPEMCDESIFGRVTDYWDTAGKCNMLLSKLDVTVKNRYYVKNLDTGAYLNCGATVAQGTRVGFGYYALTDTDLCWNGTGSHLDTPCGEWNTAATRINSNVCLAENYLKSYAGGDYPSIRAYVQLVGAKKDRDVIVNSSNGSSCTGSGTGTVNCDTANGTGPIQITYKVPATYAKFYTGVVHLGPRDGIPASSVNKCQLTNYGATRDRPKINQTQYNMSSLPQYSFPIPADSQVCTIAVKVPNHNPTVEIDSENVAACKVNENITFDLTSDDSDIGATVKYIVDWGDGGATQTFPASGLVPVGPYTISKTYAEAGTHILKVFAEDNTGARSETVEMPVECEGSTEECSFESVCGKTVSGVIEGDVCKLPDADEVNNSCIENFTCSSGAINVNGNVSCSWKNPTPVPGFDRLCSVYDYEPSTPVPIPGLQNLSSSEESFTVRNIQKSSRISLICKFYDTTNALLGQAIQQQWVKVIRVGEDTGR